MNEAQRKRAEKLFQYLRDRPRDEYASFLEVACPDDQEVRKEVETLLGSRAQAASFMESPAADLVIDQTTAGDAAQTDIAVTVASNAEVDTITKTPAKDGRQPQRFGDYELEREISRGGMGVVYQARQLSLNRSVALKMILSAQFTSRADVQQFYFEAESAAKLDHSGIVPVYEVGEHQGQYFFSMGLVLGGSLTDLVQDGPLPPRRAAELVREVAELVQYAHARNIVHRDLKPANVLLDEHGQPKVTDFGLAKNVEQDSGRTATGQVMGTTAYMPPEQAAGKMDEVGPLSDVYSLGAILFYLLTGRPPFEGNSLVETLQLVVGQEAVSPRQLNDQVDLDLATV